jgi:hypothetical protein
MNVSEEVMKDFAYPVHVGLNENVLCRTCG